MRVLLRVASVFLFVGPLLAFGTQAAEAPPYPEDAPARWDRLFSAHDADGLAALYSASAISMPFSAETLHGRDALRADFAKFFSENEGARHTTRVVELLMGNGWVVERAEYTLAFTPRGGDKEIIETGRHVVCRRRDSGAWLIAWEIWNTDQRNE